MSKGELYLPEILLSKQYPQVFRLTRPYRVKGSQFFKEGQYISVIDQKMVDLVVGVDSEGREFKVRKDRSAYVQALEEELMVYNLTDIVERIKTIKTIELKKEIKLEKNTFEYGELFTPEKVSKNFRGKVKNIELRRIRDGKSYRFPLDIAGLFKIRTEKTVSALPHLLSVRNPPLNVQFQNTPTSSNFPSGNVTLQAQFSLNVVRVLTVTEGAYVYETFSADADIFVEKCGLKLPNTILQINPRGLLACSEDFQIIKKVYKKKMKEIDSKLVEDIYALGYYGSATIEKSPNEDSHFFQASSFIRGDTRDSVISSLQKESVTSSEIEYDGRPLPYPRHSKNIVKIINRAGSDERTSNSEAAYKNGQNKNVASSMEEKINQKNLFIKQELLNEDTYITNSSSDHSLASNTSDSLKRSIGKYSSRAGSADHLLEGVYHVPNEVKYNRCSSVITVNSSDSGIGLFYSGDSSQTYYLSKLQEVSYNSIDEGRTSPNSEATYENSHKIVRPKKSAKVSQNPDYDEVHTDDRSELSKNSKNTVLKSSDAKFEDLSQMTQYDVSNILVRLNLKRFVSRFQRELVNGRLLLELDEKILVEDLEFTRFEARKLYSFIHGWRPLMANEKFSEPIKSNPAEWSVSDVISSLQKINLKNFALFCSENTVDGSLLCDILQQDKLIDSIKTEHCVPFSGLELSRLKAFILKNWRPDDTVNRTDFWGKQNKKTSMWNSFNAH